MTNLTGDILYEINETRIYLNEGQRGVFSGYLEHPATGRFWSFESVLHMLSLHERMYDLMELAGQVGFKRRDGSLAGAECSKSDEPPVLSRAQLLLPEQPAYDVQILYRQNASWQGLVHCNRNRTVQRFRSALELLLIMERDLKTVTLATREYR